MGLIGATIAASVVMLFFLGALGWMQSVKKNQNHSFLHASAIAIVSSVIDSLENEDAWINTIQANPTLACLNSPGNSCSGSSSPIDVKKADGNPIVDTAATNGASGFSFGGEFCTTFSNTPVDNSCPFRVSVVATPCAPGSSSCTSSGSLAPPKPFTSDPPTQITISLIFRPANEAFGRLKEIGGAVSNYTVTYIRGQKNVGLASACRVMGGNYNASTNFCSLGFSNGNACPNYSFLFQIDADGSRGCLPMSPPFGQICGAGSAVVGIESDGRYVCGKF